MDQEKDVDCKVEAAGRSTRIRQRLKSTAWATSTATRARIEEPDAPCIDSITLKQPNGPERSGPLPLRRKLQGLASSYSIVHPEPGIGSQ